mgnify:CR=1 FL=1
MVSRLHASPRSKSIQSPVPVKPVKVDKRRIKVVPEGCIAFKEWLTIEARRQGMTPVALRARIDRGVLPGPEIVALNKRRHFVRVKEARCAGMTKPE